MKNIQIKNRVEFSVGHSAVRNTVRILILWLVETSVVAESEPPGGGSSFLTQR